MTRGSSSVVEEDLLCTELRRWEAGLADASVADDEKDERHLGE